MGIKLHTFELVWQLWNINELKVFTIKSLSILQFVSFCSTDFEFEPASLTFQSNWHIRQIPGHTLNINHLHSFFPYLNAGVGNHTCVNVI